MVPDSHIRSFEGLHGLEFVLLPSSSLGVLRSNANDHCRNTYLKAEASTGSLKCCLRSFGHLIRSEFGKYKVMFLHHIQIKTVNGKEQEQDPIWPGNLEEAGKP